MCVLLATLDVGSGLGPPKLKDGAGAALVTFWALTVNVGGAVVAVAAGAAVLLCKSNENDGIEPSCGIGIELKSGSALFFGLDVMVGVIPATGKLNPPMRSAVFADAVDPKLIGGFGGVTKVAFGFIAIDDESGDMVCDVFVTACELLTGTAASDGFDTILTVDAASGGLSKFSALDTDVDDSLALVLVAVVLLGLSLDTIGFKIEVVVVVANVIETGAEVVATVAFDAIDGVSNESVFFVGASVSSVSV